MAAGNAEKTEDPTNSITMLMGMGMDRDSSSIYLESNPERAIDPVTASLYQENIPPFMKSQLMLAINVNDDIVGFLGKRPGTKLFLDNPDGQLVEELISYIDTNNNVFIFRVSGNHIYRYSYVGNTWGIPVKTLTASNVRMDHAKLGGYLFLCNGHDPLMFTDGTTWYNAVSGDVTTSLTADIGTTDSSIPVVSTVGFPPNGYIMIDQELIQYIGTDPTDFLNCNRGQNNTTPATHSNGASVPIDYGGYPVTPLFIESWNGRIYTIDNNSRLIWTADLGDVTDQYDWHININANVVNLATAGGTYISRDDGDIPTGMGITDSNLIVYKYRDMYQIVPDPNGNPYQIVPISTTYGTPSNESISYVDNFLMSFNPIAVFAFAGNKPMYMSKSVEDLVRGIPVENYPNICSVGYRYFMYMSVGQTTEASRMEGSGGPYTYKNVVFVYNYLTMNWFMYQYPFLINTMHVILAEDGVTENLFFGDDAGNTYTQVDDNWYLDQTPEGDIPISIWIRTRYFVFGHPEWCKEYGKFTVLAQNADNATIGFGFMRDDGKTDYNLYQTPLKRYVTRDSVNSKAGQFNRAIAYDITEQSVSQFLLEAITQEFIFSDKN